MEVWTAVAELTSLTVTNGSPPARQSSSRALERLEAMVRRLSGGEALDLAAARGVAEELVTLQREGMDTERGRSLAAEQRPWVLRLAGVFVEDYGSRWASPEGEPSRRETGSCARSPRSSRGPRLSDRALRTPSACDR
jgi:hypothetical protein